MARQIIDHFKVVFSVTWPLNGNEAAGDLVLMKTSLLLLCKVNQVVLMLNCWNLNEKAKRSVSRQGHFQHRLHSQTR